MSNHCVYFIAIARVNDGVILARWVHSKKNQKKNHYITTVSNLTSNATFSSRAVPNKRFCLRSTGFSLNFMADEDQFAYVVLTKEQYPERVVFKLVAQLQKEFENYKSEALKASENQLSGKMYDVFNDLGSRYDDLAKVDKLSKALRSVNAATQQLEKNLEKMEELHVNTSELEKNASDLSNESTTLKETSAEYHKRMKCRKIKITAAIIAGVVVVLAIIIIPIAVKFAPSGGSSSSERRLLRGFDY